MNVPQKSTQNARGSERRSEMSDGGGAGGLIGTGDRTNKKPCHLSVSRAVSSVCSWCWKLISHRRTTLRGDEVALGGIDRNSLGAFHARKRHLPAVGRKGECGLELRGHCRMGRLERWGGGVKRRSGGWCHVDARREIRAIALWSAATCRRCGLARSAVVGGCR